MKKEMTATTLRLILSVAMFLLVVATVVGFYFAYTKLSEYATSISHLNAQAQASNDSLQTLKQLEANLDAQREVITKARSIVAQSQQYLYQDQIVNDLSRIAGNSGVVITQFNFDKNSAAASVPTAGTDAAAVPTMPSPAGNLKSETVTVTIKSPLAYQSLMNFIKAIEQNPLKMQIARISIVKDTDANVSSETFTIEVYVR